MKCIHPSADVISFEMLEKTILVIQKCHHCKKQFDEHVDYDEFPVDSEE
jgi:hypothetical protein